MFVGPVFIGPFDKNRKSPSLADLVRDPNNTAIFYVVDVSRSMGGFGDASEEALNDARIGLLAQAEEDGREYYLSVIIFGGTYEVLYPLQRAGTQRIFIQEKIPGTALYTTLFDLISDLLGVARGEVADGFAGSIIAYTDGDDSKSPPGCIDDLKKSAEELSQLGWLLQFFRIGYNDRQAREMAWQMGFPTKLAKGVPMGTAREMQDGIREATGQMTGNVTGKPSYFVKRGDDPLEHTGVDLMGRDDTGTAQRTDDPIQNTMMGSGMKSLGGDITDVPEYVHHPKQLNPTDGLDNTSEFPEPPS